MPNEKRVAILVGSLRRDSFSRKIAKLLVSVAPTRLALQFVEIGELAHYNEDLEGAGRTPPSWESFRKELRPCDAVLFVTPEYNRSVPGVLKNALDVGSRPYGKSVWDGKPAAIVSVSPGALGAFGANHHLRQSLVFLNMPTLQQPEAYIGGVAKLIADDGSFATEETRAFFETFMTKFSDWIATVSR